MVNGNLCWTPASELATAIAKKKVSPVEAVDAVLDRIEKTKSLNAYVTVDADSARGAARAAERAVMKRGAKLGPIHGVRGFTKDGLPIGLQIVGRRYDDATVLRAAAAFETARPWAQRRPPEAA